MGIGGCPLPASAMLADEDIALYQAKLPGWREHQGETHHTKLRQLAARAPEAVRRAARPDMLARTLERGEALRAVRMIA